MHGVTPDEQVQIKARKPGYLVIEFEDHKPPDSKPLFPPSDR